MDAVCIASHARAGAATLVWGSSAAVRTEVTFITGSSTPDRVRPANSIVAA